MMDRTTEHVAAWMVSRFKLSLRGKQRRVGDDNDTAHDGMDAALIGIPAGRKARDCVGSGWFDSSGIEGASAPFFKASIVGHGMVGRSRIVPPYRSTRGHRNRGRHIVG